MIVKSLSRKSNSGQLVKYICRYVLKDNKQPEVKNKELLKQEDATVILRYNLRSRSVKGYIKEFQENESYRLYKRKDSVTLFHTIHSFSPLDKEQITDKILKDIAKKYVELRGTNNLYLGVAHKEKNHTHLHILVSGTQLNGYSSRVSKQNFQHIKLELEKYNKEKYPQLIHSFTDHEKSKRKTKEEIIEHIKTTRQTDKQTLLDTLDKTYTKSKSQQDFFSQLTAEGYEPYYRNNKFQGVLVDGRKFRINRLGYDEQKISDLDNIHTTEQKTLSKLKNLRIGQKRIFERKSVEEEQHNIVPVDILQPTLFDELQDIRAQRAEQEIEERTIETDKETQDQYIDEEGLETDEGEAVLSLLRHKQKQEILNYEYEK